MSLHGFFGESSFPVSLLCQTAAIIIWQEGQSNKHARRPFSAIRRSLTLRLDGFARSRGALQDPHEGKAPNAKNPPAVGRRRAAGPQPPWGAARRRRTARGAGGRWAGGPAGPALAPELSRRRAKTPQRTQSKTGSNHRSAEQPPHTTARPSHSVHANALSLGFLPFGSAHLSAAAILCGQFYLAPQFLRKRTFKSKTGVFRETSKTWPKVRVFKN